MDSGVIVKEFRTRFDSIVTNGQGSMKGRMFRIAHLGTSISPTFFLSSLSLKLSLPPKAFL